MVVGYVYEEGGPQDTNVIEFKRLGFSSEKELELGIHPKIVRKEDVYRVTLELTGN